MMVRIKLFLVICFVAVSAYSGAQGFVVRGKVMDGVANEPIIGATVVEVSESDGRFLNGTISDFNGDFTLEVQSENAIFKVSFIGFKEQQFNVEGKPFFNVTLEPDVTQLSEAVVVATRMTSDGLSSMPARDLTSASVTIDMSQMEEVAATSADEALQGQVSGVDIIMNSGDPGAGSSIVIRGMTSLSGSNPLFVIDGIPQMTKASNDFDFGSADVEDIGDLVSIPPSDIKSITVLKDAASTAVWGTEGANGVILIETNKGTRGKTRIDYMYKLYVDEQPPPIPLLNGDEYIILQREELFNPSGLYALPDELALDPGLGKVYWNNNANTDWVDAVTNDYSLANEHNFKVSGGGEKTTYYASVNYLSRNSTTINSGYKRLTNRINLDYLVSDKIRFNAQFVYSNDLKEDNFEYRTSVRQMAYIKAPNMTIWEYDANGVLTGDYNTPISNYQHPDGKRYYNPVAMAMLGKNDKEENQISSNFTLQYRMTNAIQFKGLISYIYRNTKNKQFLPYTAIGAHWLDGLNNQAVDVDGDQTRLLIRLQSFYNKTFANDHLVNGMITWDIRQDQNSGGGTLTSNTASLLITDPAAVAPFGSVKNSLGSSRMLSARGNLNYKYKDRYVFAVTFSAEGSTKFGVEERWGFFPSGSMLWRFGSEPFLQGLGWLDKESRARLSYGINGNSGGIGNFTRHATYSTWGNYMGHAVVRPTQIQLDNLKWETTSTWNVGFDAYLFQNKVDVTFDAYKKNTTDIIWTNYDVPTSSGLDVIKSFNGGEVENIGWEMAMNYTALRNRDWVVRVKANLSQNRNQFLAFPDNFNNEQSNTLGNGQYPRRANIGEPIGSFYGVKYDGVYPTTADAISRDANGNIQYDVAGKPLKMSFNEGQYYFKGGDARYVDINHDGSIDILDAVYLGDSNPKLHGGFGTSVTYKKALTVSVDFFSRLGFQIVNGTALQTQDMGGKNNQSKAVLHRWRRPGMDYEDMIPRAYFNHTANNLGSDRYVEDGDFLTLNNLSVKYRVPDAFCKKLKVSSININLNGRKLALWTNYTGQSPEIAPKGNPFWMGVDNSKTPVPRVYSFSLNVGF